MTRTGLTEAEERHILLLMEGDVSDLELELDDELEEDNIDDVLVDNNADDVDINTIIQLSNKLSAEIEDVSVKSDYENADNLAQDLQESEDSEDNIPLYQLVHQQSTSREDGESEDDCPLVQRLRKRQMTKNLMKHASNNKKTAQKGKKLKKKLKWKKKDIDPVDSTCDVSFTEADQVRSPLEYFKIFFDDNIINNIVDQTNLYSVQKKLVSVNTNYNEICNFFGILIISGIVNMPSYRMYWAQETRYPVIADVMSRNRFEKLRTYLHFNDNEKMKNRGDPDYDKLFKLRPFINALQENFSNIEPEEHNSIDEIIIPFKGRSSLKQYVKNKPHKWGIKVFARAGMSGIVYEFEIYVGKGTADKAELGISGDIVVKLCSNLPKNRNFKVYTDNWFSSYNLMVALKNLGILSVGTVRTNRLENYKPKEDKVLKQEGRGSSDYYTEPKNNVIAVKWQDNKSVNLISTYVGVEPIGKVQRWSQSDKKRIDVNRPHIVKIYNTYMGGVDLNDMLVALYRTKTRVKRFYLKIVYHMLDICIVNAWMLYRRDCVACKIANFKKLIVFRSEIGHSLLKCYSIIRKRGRPSSSREPTPTISRENTPTPTRKRPVVARPIYDVRYDENGHWPVHIEPKQRCRQCSAYTRMACDKCKMPLCITKDRNCFISFHKP